MAEVINIEQGRLFLGVQADPRFDRLTQLACRLLQATNVCVGVPGVWLKSQAGTSQPPKSCIAHLQPRTPSKLIWQTGDGQFYASYPLYVAGYWVALFYAQGPLTTASHIQQNDFKDLAEQCQLLFDLQHQERRNYTLLEQQKQQQALLNTLYRSTQDALLSVSATGQILTCNPQAEELLGYSAPALLAMDIQTLLPWEEDSVREFTARAALEAGQTPLLGWSTQLLYKHTNGQIVDLRATVRLLAWGDQPPEELEYLVLLNRSSTQNNSNRPSERALLNTIIDSIPYPVYARDCQGTYLVANKASQKLITTVIQGMTNGDPQQQLYREAVNLSEASHAQVIKEKTIHHSVMKTPDNESFTVTKSPIFDKEQNVIGVVTVTHEITDLNKASQELDNDRHLLSVLHSGLTNYGALLSSNDVWVFLKRALLDLTKSEYALIGEVVTSQQRKKLKVHAISNLVKSPQSHKLMEQLRNSQMLLDSPNTLLGKTYLQGEMVLINDFQTQAPYSQFPPGHPKFKNYLGLPILDQGEVIGMCAISTSPHNYTSELAAWLEPFLSTCSLMIKLHRQLDEQKNMLSELQQAHHQAEKASQAKTDFLSRMSHELRTPLNAINGFAQLLLGAKQQPALNSKQQRQAEQILKNGQYLLDLINEVLDLARIESGNLNLSMESVDLLETIDDCIDSLEPHAHSANITLHRPKYAPKIWAQADLTRLCQVLINLLSNAIKYNHSGGHAWVQVHCDQHKVRISVKDNGLGISTEKYSELFKPFNRLGAENGNIEGTGVGLALAKKLIEMMDGRIGFSSTLGKGSTFWFELQLAADKPLASEAQPEWNQHHPSTTTAPYYKVLYIEDNPANLQLMQEIFEELDDVELSCATTGAQGIEKARREQPQLILLDINLPDFNGYQVLERLRADPLTAGITVCGISANAMPKDLETARAAGFNLYLTKPLDLHKLFDHLETFKTQFQKAAD